MQEQDDELDRLGESIGRQHELSIQIGDELEGHIALLDDVDGHVDRHASRLESAKKRLGKFRRNAGESRSLMTIIGLIIVLVILIVILKWGATNSSADNRFRSSLHQSTAFPFSPTTFPIYMSVLRLVTNL